MGHRVSQKIETFSRIDKFALTDEFFETTWLRILCHYSIDANSRKLHLKL